MDINSLSQKQKILLACSLLVLGVCFIIIPRFVGKENTNKLTNLVEKGAINEEKEVESNMYVEITGQVMSPGVYEISRKMLVIELIDLAGGLNTYADLQYLHKDLPLSTYVEPFQKIYIPGTFEKSGSGSSTGKGAVSGKVSINNATSAELETLTGVGPATAAKIIAARPYSKIEDLKNVEGIGEKTFDSMVSQLSL